MQGRSISSTGIALQEMLASQEIFAAGLKALVRPALRPACLTTASMCTALHDDNACISNICLPCA